MTNSFINTQFLQFRCITFSVYAVLNVMPPALLTVDKSGTF